MQVSKFAAESPGGDAGSQGVGEDQQKVQVKGDNNNNKKGGEGNEESFADETAKQSSSPKAKDKTSGKVYEYVDRLTPGTLAEKLKDPSHTMLLAFDTTWFTHTHTHTRARAHTHTHSLSLLAPQLPFFLFIFVHARTLSSPFLLSW